MKKLILIFIMVIILFFRSVNIYSNTNDPNKLKQSINKVISKYEGVELLVSPTCFNEKFHKIHSLKDFENILKAVKANSNKIVTVPISFPSQIKTNNTFLKTSNEVMKLSTNIPYHFYDNNLLIWKNCTFEYTYSYFMGRPYFTSIGNVTTKLTDFHPTIEWTQNNYITNIFDFKSSSAFIDINGYGYVGVNLYGLPLVIKTNENLKLIFNL